MDPDFGTQPETNKPTLASHLIDFIQTLVVFASIGLAIYLFVAQPHRVSGSSMFPNFKDADYIITDKLTFKFGQPSFGDVIVFKNPQDETQDFIKRIIGKPGDKVRVNNGHVYVNGIELKEPYLAKDVVTQGQTFLQDGDEKTVTKNHYFVLGDNRTRSSDSREWGFINKDEIIGKVFLRYWPKDEIGFYPAAIKN